MNYRNRKKLASGLIEMLIAMAIYGFAVIGITALNADNFRTIKDNELEDLANQHMIKSLEYFKAGTTGGPGTIQQKIEDALADTTKNNNPLDTTVCFKVDSRLDSTTNYLTLTQVNESSLVCNLIRDCPPIYKMTADNEELKGFQFCNQIVVTKVNVGSESGYRITSRINYKLGNRIPSGGETYFVNEIIGFRPFTF